MMRASFQGLFHIVRLLMGFFLFELGNLAMIMNYEGKICYYAVKPLYGRGYLIGIYILISLGNS